jgi:tetratricopeptide (TPR) repeat protein
MDRREIQELALEDFEEHISWWKKVFIIPDVKDPKVRRRKTSPSVTASHPAQPVSTASDPTVVSNAPTQRNTIPGGVVTINGTEKYVVGEILDANGSPVVGANVVVKGTTQGTITDSNGQYTISMPLDGVLVVSFVGYNSYELIPEPGQANITLVEDVSALSEVVVVGYAQALQGRVAGVAVESGNSPSLPPPTSVVGAKPLYIIDGILSTPEEAAKVQGQIAEVNALRSSDASHIYGSRAADGVIVITTRDAVSRGVVLPDTIASKLVSISLEEWDPKAPYLDSLRKTPRDLQYSVYLYFKRMNYNTPSFYLATGNFFIEKGDKKTGIRILSNIAELKIEDHELLKILAFKLTQMGENDPAIGLFETVLKLRGNEPQSYRDLALACANDGQHQRALDLYLKLINMDGENLDWEDRFPLVKNVAIDEMNHLVEKQKYKLNLSQIPAGLRRPAPVDLRIIVDWTSLDTDIDLYIKEPDGEQCYYKNQLTKSGGKLMEDFTDGYGPEVYMLRRAITGKYEVSIDFYDDRQQKIAGPAFVQITIIKYYGTPREDRKQLIVQLDDENVKQLKVAEVEF